MEELIQFDSPELVDAVRTWSGWGQFSWPHRDESRLESKLGSAKAAQLMPVIKKLAEDFYRSNAYSTAIDLSEMGKIAKEQFKRLHPNLAEEVSNILEWCYTFDSR